MWWNSKFSKIKNNHFNIINIILKAEKKRKVNKREGHS